MTSAPDLRPFDAGRHRAVDTSELFFDLVFVFAITGLSGLIHADATLLGVLRVVILWAVVYWLWTVTTIQASFRDMTTARNRLVLFALTLCALVLAIAIPDAYGERGMLVVGAYLAGRLIVLLA